MKLSNFSIFLTAFAIISFGSCQTKSDKQEKTIGVYDANNCNVSKITYEYPDMTIELSFSYLEKNIISEISRTINGFQGRKTKFIYVDNKVEKIEIHHEDTLSYYHTIADEGDGKILSLYDYVENEWININKTSVRLNEFNEQLSLDDFYIDSVGVWSRKGTLYDYVWEGGNLTTIKNYIVKGSINKGIDLSKKEKYIFISIEDVEYKVDNYTDLEEFYTSEYKYSELLNPLHTLSIGEFIAPNNFNCSRYFPIKEVKRYKNGDIITTNIECETNAKGYPTECVIKADLFSNGTTADTEYKMHFEYDNCK